MCVWLFVCACVWSLVVCDCGFVSVCVSLRVCLCVWLVLTLVVACVWLGVLSLKPSPGKGSPGFAMRPIRDCHGHGPTRAS